MTTDTAAPVFDLSTLTSKDGFTIIGAVSADALGSGISSAGDVNGDGIDDMIVGAYQASPSSKGTAGSAYVLYGKAGGLANIDLSSLTATQGFRIDGAKVGDNLGISVASGGDVNGDGIDDIIVGANSASPSATFAGSTYVIYGKSGGLSNIDLSTLTKTMGFKIDGSFNGGYSGYSVSSAGDLNDDGIDDVLVGAFRDSPGSKTNAGAAYVIYGKLGGLDNVDLGTLTAAQGFAINGATAGDSVGTSVSKIGDVNGDGVDDVVIGASGADPAGRSNAGAAYIIYGKAGGSANIQLGSLTASQGIKISGAAASDSAGGSVSSAGDVNGDGVADIIIGAYGAAPSGRNYAGAAYVIFGNKNGLSDIDLNSLTSSQGFRISGAATGDQTGVSVSGAGDVNGDGIDDIIVGARSGSSGGKLDSGKSYVIFGKKSGLTDIDLPGLLSSQGFIIGGAVSSDHAGNAVAYAGDLNNDGAADIIIAAKAADPASRTNAGAAYVIYGTAPSVPKITELGTTTQAGVHGAGETITITVTFDTEVAVDTTAGTPKLKLETGTTDRSATYVSGSGGKVLTFTYVVQPGDKAAILEVTGADALSLNGGLIEDAKGNAADLTVPVPGATGSLSKAAEIIIDVAPTVAVSTNAVTATENVATTLGAGLTLSDTDDTTLASAKVAITAGFVAGEDSLAFTGTQATGDISGSFDGTSGALTLTSAKGAATLDQWRAALASVTYTNLADAPTTAARTVTFTATDPANVSSSAQQSLTIKAVNDAPAFPDPTGPGKQQGEEGTAITLDTSTLLATATDPDGDALTYKITEIPSGTLTIDGLAAKVGDVFSLNASLVWTPPANTVSPQDALTAVRVAAFDGVAQSEKTVAFSVTLKDVDPTLTGPSSVTLAENSLVGTEVARMKVSGDQDGLTFGFADASKTAGGKAISADGAFAIDLKTGIVTVNDAAKLDFETNPTLNLTVTVDDEDADTTADSTLSLTVNLENVNEAPVITATGAVLKITDLGRLPAADVTSLTGATAKEGFGTSVSGAGDVNGDGIDDIIVGAPDGSASPGPGAAYVIYGKKGGLSSFSVANLTPADGFKISGATAKDQAGFSVSSAGDLNGDGIDDLIIGAPNVDKPANANANAAAPGAAYVVYGKAGGSGNIDLSTLSATDGFKISAGIALGRAGYSVASAGDINKDGVDDVIIGGTLIGLTATASGAAYVVYGKTGGLSAIDLSKLTDGQGFGLGARQYDAVGTSVSGIGDVNGDGIDDMVIGAPGSDLNGPNSGTAFVVYGNADGLAKFNMTTEMGTKGFKIIGAGASNAIGTAVSAAGDVNGDGIADIIVSSNKAEGGKGAAYVIYGTKSGHEDVTLSSLTAATGFKIVGAANGDGAGYSVSSAGDVNGDGIGDLLVGATGSDGNGTESGTTYVVFGTKGERGTLDLSALTPDQGVALEGTGNLSGAGYAVSAAGDLNGDGIADLIVGAPNANSDGSGAAFIIYGKKGFAPSAPVEGTTATLTYIDLQKVAAVSDVDGDTVSYKVMALGEGTLTVDGAAAVAGQTLITPTSVVTWTPPANTTGTLGAFTLAAFDGTTTSSTTVPVQIAVADVDPVLTGPATASLAENSPAGTEVAKLKVSGDQDGLTFGFADASKTADGKAISADGAFAIDIKTGIVTVNDASKLDFETKPTLTLTATVDDEDADSLPDSTLTLTISLTDTNDAPVLTGLPTTAVAAIAGQPLALPAFTLTDQDSTLFTVTLSTVNGTLSGLVDGDAGTAGIQLSGTAADLQARLAAATFTPIVDGEARVNLTVSDGAGGTVTGALPFQVSTPLGSTVAIGEAIVTTKTVTETDGTVTQTVTVPAVTDNGGTPAPADIPLVKDNADTLLSATLPTGVGLTATGTPTAQASELSLLELIAQIQKHTPDGSTEQAQLTAGGTDFLEDLPSNTPLLVQTLVLTGSDTGGTPIVVSAPAGTAPIALVVDASALPPGTQINFENVAFAAVVGPVTLGGGSGAQVVYADDAPQTIMLGADNDELHGGGGNDTVGSAGGDDRIFGEAGDDTVFGGPGRDLLHGGLGTDTARFDGNRADYEILQDRAVTLVRSLTDPNDVDTLVNVESLTFADGKVDLTVSEGIKEIAALYANVLGRQADLDGLQYYAGLVDRGLSVGDIALAFLTSPEAIAKGTGAAAGDLTVEQLYRTLFGREPDADGLAYHKAQLADGVPLADVVAHFVTSPEMVTHLPTATGLDFVVDADLQTGNVTGTSGDDHLEGGPLDDRLVSNGGQDVIDGHAGDDTVVLSGNRADFSIEQEGVHWEVKPIILPNLPNNGALLAVAILKNIEHVQFDDGTIDLTPNSDLSWIGALYTQVLGRQGDEGGLMAHLADYQGGKSQGEVALSFMLSPEAIAVGHGAASVEDLTADTVYQALLGHAPTEADHATYGSLESDVLALANALMGSQEMHGHYLTPKEQDFFI